jgi:uncharacterized protein
MIIREIIWIPEFREKIARKHGVSESEVEEVVFNSTEGCFAGKGDTSGEDLYFFAGQTDAGRYLMVFFILKHNHDALILSARDMTRKERKQHG